MRILGLDFETFSSADIVACGSFKYIEDPAFEPLLLAYAFDDDPVKCIDFTAGETIPGEVLAAMTDPGVIKAAYNAAFERYVFKVAYGIYCPPEQWLDSMPLAAACGLPLGLAKVCDAMGLPEDLAKKKEGQDLINYFCKPCKPTKNNGHATRHCPEDAPEKWEAFKGYNIRDVEVERTIRRRLMRWKMDDIEQKFWCLDAHINERGIRFDRRIAQHATEFDAKYKAELTQRAIDLTGMDNPKSVSQIKNWLADQEGVQFPSLNKKVIADVVSQLSSEKSREFMAIRANLSKSSTAKYAAMLRCGSADDHVRGCFQFNGGHTGRFAGRLLQLQNLTKNHMPDIDTARALVRDGDYETTEALYGSISSTLSELVRPTLIPEEGHRFIVADFSAIEARVTAWFAKEQWRLDVFNSGGDIYCASASQMFHVPVEKHGQNSELRAKGKVAELALGYGGGVAALKAFGADKMGMSEEEMVETVDKWRGASPHITDLWKALERAAIRCVVRKTPTVSTLGDICFDLEDGVLFMTLPSGRRMAYWGAAYEESTSRFRHGKTLSYMYVDQTTKKWSRIETWGGKLVENCLAEGTPVLTSSGWKPIERVTMLDRLWDGECWVQHAGLRQKGLQLCLTKNGVWLTPDHKILTEEGWKDAKDTNGLDWLPVRLPDGCRPEPRQEPAGAPTVGGPPRLRLRQALRHAGHTKSGTAGRALLLRLYEKAIHPRGGDRPRNDTPPRLRRLAVHEAEVYGAEPSRLEELRRARDNRVRPLAQQLRELLGGHGRRLGARAGLGPNRQQRRLFPGELPVGDKKSKLPKQTRSPVDALRRSSNSCKTGECGGRDKLHHAAVSAGPQHTNRAFAGPRQCYKPVYDLLNAGPQHCFTIFTERGPALAHNCVQATARDCLRETMLALDDAGFDIRMHCHDEVIVTEPIGSGRGLDDMCKIMAREIPWAPGLPLRGDGFEAPYYMKD